MEDAQYVLDSDEDSVANWSIGELESFLLNGVIVFGSRDNYDYRFLESKIDLFIDDNKLKIVESYTG